MQKKPAEKANAAKGSECEEDESEKLVRKGRAAQSLMQLLVSRMALAQTTPPSLAAGTAQSDYLGLAAVPTNFCLCVSAGAEASGLALAFTPATVEEEDDLGGHARRPWIIPAPTATSGVGVADAETGGYAFKVRSTLWRTTRAAAAFAPSRRFRNGFVEHLHMESGPFPGQRFLSSNDMPLRPASAP